MQTLDYLVLAAYLLLLLGLGVYFGRRQSRREFFAASNSMGWLTVGLSVMATLFSSNSFVFYPSAAFGDSLKIGLSLVAFSLMAPVVIWCFIPMYARLNCQTAYEYLEMRFDFSVRCLASGLFILLRIAWMATATFAASLVIARVADVNQTAAILVIGVVAILYTMLGGLRAVMWTDVVQFGIFAATIFLALGLLISQQPAGLEGMISVYQQRGDGILVDFSCDAELQYGSWAILIGVFLEALSAFGADQVAVQRYISARSERVSQIGFGINLLGMWLVIPGLLLIGVGLYAHYQQRPDEFVPVLADQWAREQPLAQLQQGAPAALASAATQADGNARREAATNYFIAHLEAVPAEWKRLGLQDHALPHFVHSHFPAGMTGLFLAALMAAVMSSIDSGVHSVTTAVVVDFRDRLFPHLKPDSDADDVWFIRLLVIGIGALSITLACFVGPLGSVFDIGKKMTAAFGGPLLGVFVLAFFSRRVASLAVGLGAVAATAVTMVLMYVRANWFSVWFWPIGFGLSIFLGLGLSLWMKPPAGRDLTWRRICR
ncbi:MAG: hypothetical protein KDA42_03755 [Planctomycetales bacterium]|nr:hypothetical protein [Planctomycetales bacterium]